uniref:FBD domain-containing protein n=1 Tax=Arundo donax TaxID=35708 RepID=A0A0A9DSA0_ARUDO
MKKIVCICNEMHFMEFILSKARVLRVLSVRLAPDALCSDEAVIAIEKYPRASPDAQVIFFGTESANM